VVEEERESERNLERENGISRERKCRERKSRERVRVFFRERKWMMRERESGERES